MRGGAYKPRTSPYDFQGLAEEGLRLLELARKETGLPLVTEVMSQRDVERVESSADILQIGARNVQNVGRARSRSRMPSPQGATLVAPARAAAGSRTNRAFKARFR